MKYTANTNRICEELSLSTYDEWHDAHWSFKPSEARALAKEKLVTGCNSRKLNRGKLERARLADVD